MKLKLRKVETIYMYESDDGERYRHMALNGTDTEASKAFFVWQMLKTADDGLPWWSSNISNEMIEQLDEAAKSESLNS